MLKAEIREKYDRFASWYARLDILLEVAGLARLRRSLLRRATGAVLEVAAGTGRNLAAYPPGVQLTAADFSPRMLEAARGRADDGTPQPRFVLADSEALPFRSRRFDTVVSTLSLCTYVDPLAALRELARVCRPDGAILLLEHGRSNRRWLARWQDRTAERHAQALGCHWNREPLDLVKQAGLEPVSAGRRFLGIVHLIEARVPG